MMLAAALEERIALMAPARRLRQALAIEVLERYAGRRPIRVLDAGCGDGRLALAIAERHRSWDVVGVDQLDWAIAGARKRGRDRRLTNVRFVRANLVQPPLETGFDAVLAIECLSEIPDDQAAVRMMSAALVETGMLIVHVPERSWAPILPGSSTTWREEVRHGYTGQEIAELMRAAGIASVEVRPTMRGCVTVAQEVRDRLKAKRVSVRALAFPAMIAAVCLEQCGITWGPDRALLASGRKAPLSTVALHLEGP